LTKTKKTHLSKGISLSTLITAKVIEQWYLCQANFLLPGLVLLTNPTIFLVIVQIYTLLGVIISFKKKSSRINSTILSTYPFLFHICFMIFYWTESTEIIIITELVCLVVFLMGVVHHFFTLLFELGKTIAKIYRICRKQNSVAKEANEKE